MLASDNLTIDQQNLEMDKAFGKRSVLKELAQEELNQKVAEVACKVYQSINKNWTYCGGDLKSSSIDSKFWDFSTFKVHSGQYVPTFVFKGKDLKTLPVALEDVIQHSAKVDCTIASKIAKIIVLKEILGEESFALYVEQLLIDKDLSLTSSNLFHQLPFGFYLGENKPYQLTTERKLGHFVYISNIRDYGNFMPDGPSQGGNAVCVGPDQYIGFGERFKAGPLTEQQIADGFYHDLKENIRFQTRYPTKEIFFMVRNNHQEQMDESSQYGYFNVEAIY